MAIMIRGRYRARMAEGEADVARALDLRARAFRGASGQSDADAHDALCRHVLIEDAGTGALVACFRVLPLTGGDQIGRSYSGQFYDLSSLEGYAGGMVELGRFCLAPGCHDPDVLRLAWGFLTQIVDAEGAGMLFGCSSFSGTDAAAYLDAFMVLKERHLAPRRWRPRIKAPKVFRFASLLRGRRPDLGAAMRAMPPLLRTYLAMGGWVSDHAVVDQDLGTMHVFTGLEIAAIPPARSRALRLIAGQV